MTSSEQSSGQRKTLSWVIDALCSGSAPVDAHLRGELGLPSRATLHELMLKLRAVLFPAHYGPQDLSPESLRFHVGATLDSALRILEHQVHRALAFASDDGAGLAARAT